MKIDIEGLTEFGLVKTLDCLHSCIFYLEIDGGPRYLVAPSLKKIKETKSKHSYPCFKIAGASVELLNGAFMYYGYTMD